MILNLTPELRSAIVASEGGPIHLRDEETAAVYVVVDEETHRRAMEALDRQQSLESVRRGVAQMEAGLGRPASEAEADLAAIREGIADMKAGRTISLDEADRRIRTEFGFSPRRS